MRALSYCAAAICGCALAVVAFIAISIWNDATTTAPVTIREPEPLPVEVAIAEQARKAALRDKDRDAPYDRPATEADILRGFGGEETLAILRNPEHVSAMLIEPPERGRSFPAHEYKPLGEARPVKPEDAAAIVDVILDPASSRIYLDGVARGCYPVYHVRMEFTSGAERIDLYFCLMCAYLAVYSQGEAVGGMVIDPITEELAKKFVQVFPDDDPLRGLAGVLPARVPDPSEMYGKAFSPKSAQRSESRSDRE